VNVKIEPGTYVVAVSGGVDSTALLHALHRRPDLKLVVAHFDHGIRDDSHQDRQRVRSLAEQYGLPFVYGLGQLGPKASEAKARRARYEFLNKVRLGSGAKAVITAHHKDDAIETTMLHLLRGTGRRGLGSLRSTDVVKRPILEVSKNDLLRYAATHKLIWRNDPTNLDTRYLRNHIRHNIIPQLTPSQKHQFHELISQMRQLNQEVDSILDLHLHVQPSSTTLDKKWFISLPHSVACEVLAHWLRRHNIRDFDKKFLEKLVVSAKTLANGKTVSLNKEYNLRVKSKVLALEVVER